MVTVGGGNLSVMTCRREPLRKDRPIPESVVEIDRDGRSPGVQIGAAASDVKQSAIAIRAT